MNTNVEEIANIKNALKKIGYKAHTTCGRQTMELQKSNLPYVKTLLSFHYSEGYGYSIVWSLALFTDEYLVSGTKSKFEYICNLINFVFTGQKNIIKELERRWSNNQLQYCWSDDDFEEMIEFIEKNGHLLLLRYADYKNIVEDILIQEKFSDDMMKKHGKPIEPKIKVYANLAILYKLAGDKENAILMMENCIHLFSSFVTPDNVGLLRYIAYLEHLKTGTPLPDIKDDSDQASAFVLEGNDVYILVNKKSAKEEDLLKLFGGADRFGKSEKAECGTTGEGVVISKAGKWAIIRCDAMLYINLDNTAFEEQMRQFSDTYGRVMLFINQDTSGTFGFIVYKKGERIRQWMSSEGEVLDNVGKPIRGESKRFTDTLGDNTDPWTVANFLDSQIGLTHGDLEKCKAKRYS